MKYFSVSLCTLFVIFENVLNIDVQFLFIFNCLFLHGLNQVIKVYYFWYFKIIRDCFGIFYSVTVSKGEIKVGGKIVDSKVTEKKFN